MTPTRRAAGENRTPHPRGRQGDETFVPSGSTRLAEGDVLVLLSTARYREEIEELARRVEQGAG